MKLSHLGATYTVTPHDIETVATDIKCRFLGKTTNLRVAKRMPADSALHKLKYRGVSYQA